MSSNKTELRTETKKRNGYSIKKDISAWLLILPSLFCIFMFVIRPQVQGIIWSFFEMNGFSPQGFAGLSNYKKVITDVAFLKSFTNTWKYVFWSLVIGMPMPIIIATIMNELVSFRKTTRVLIYLPTIMPTAAVSLLWYFMYYPDASGLLNMFLAKFGIEPYVWLQDARYTIIYIIISATWQGMGSTALYYFSAMQGINRELYEAAVMDGAGFFTRVRVVTIPQMAGILILFVIKQIIGVFNTMEQPLQMTGGGPNNASVTLGLMNYRYAFVLNKPGMALAQGVMMFFVLSLFTFIYFKLNKIIEEGQM